MRPRSQRWLRPTCIRVFRRSISRARTKRSCTRSQTSRCRRPSGRQNTSRNSRSDLHRNSTSPRGGRPLVEAGFVLRPRDLRGVHGFFASHILTAVDGTTIKLQLDIGETYGWVHVEHWPVDAGWATSSYDVALISTSQPFGGRRWRFVCPERSKPCSVLCLPIGAGQFASRQAHGLAFASQRLRAPARAAIRARQVRLDLGGSADPDAPFPERPRGMWARTYVQLRDAGNDIRAHK